ncbi:MAG TPA: hypothetical protein VMV92_08895 [Streptosporangiaceae bacterium]|nr:hypothetical protein [Streptosporangiaceae bacterium]
MRSGRRARRQGRAREFGARHPRLSLVIVCALLACVIAVCGYQLSYGTYLGRAWGIAALAGMAAAAGLNALALVSTRRHRLAAGRVVIAWLVLVVASASAIKFPFPQGPYGSVQAFFNVAHAALLGYEAVTCAAIVALFAYLLLRSRARARRPAARAGHAPRRAGHAPGRAGLPARLRFPAAKAAPWRAGRLIAANGRVTWLSLNGDADVDLTSACQALPTLPAAAHGRQPRTTMLATASGVAEVDVSPRALAELVRSLRRPPYGDTAHSTARD